MKKIQVLVVDDREENRNAAAEYFKTREDVEVDFAESYTQAMEMLNKKVYYYGLFDLELPKKEGDEPEKLGFDLAEKADDLMMPWAIITAGRGHGRTEEEMQCANATHFLGDIDKTPREFILKPSKSNPTYEKVYLSTKRKSNPISWKLVFECLEEVNGSNEPAEARETHSISCGIERTKMLCKRYNFWQRPKDF